MKVYVLMDWNNGFNGVYSSEEKALNAIEQYSNTKFSRTEKSKNGRNIEVYFTVTNPFGEEEEVNPFTIFVREIDEQE